MNDYLLITNKKTALLGAVFNSSLKDTYTVATD